MDRHPARRLRAALIGEPLPLPESLVARWPELAVARWRVGGLPPRVGGWLIGAPTVAGVTLWRTIFLAPSSALDPGLLLHEVAHVHQFEGSPLFPLRYLAESLRRGYRHNRYEADAERWAADRLRERGGAPRRGDG